MALRADLLGKVGLVNRRSRVRMRLDVMLPVTAGAPRRVEVALPQCDRVDALPVIPRLLLMATRTGIREMQPVDGGRPDRGLVHRMGAVAVHAAGRFRLAGLKGRAVDRVIKAGDKLGPRAGPLPRPVLAHVTGFAQGGLPQLQPNGRAFEVLGGNRLAVAGQAIGCDSVRSPRVQAVSRRQVTLLRLLM